MTTFHELGAMDALKRALQDPGYADALCVAAESIRTGRWCGEFLDAVGYQGTHTSGGPRGQWGLVQLFATSFIHQNMLLDRVWEFKVRAAAAPEWDHMRAENAKAVADLPHPFRAYVDPDQHGDDADGWLEWTEEITGTASHWFADTDTVSKRHERIAPFRVPLEIGTTMPTRTAAHLGMDRGVARWPYGTDWITVFYCPELLPPKMAMLT